LAVWLPATQHCKLENVPGLGFLHCATDKPGTSDCDSDSCQELESGFYKTTEQKALIPERAWTLSFFAVAVPAEDCPSAASFGFASDFPQELSQSWQFLSRTALPVRSPTLLS
jgi:hypothetical protein